MVVVVVVVVVVEERIQKGRYGLEQEKCLEGGGGGGQKRRLTALGDCLMNRSIGISLLTCSSTNHFN